jgi:hypothetical protein
MTTSQADALAEKVASILASKGYETMDGFMFIQIIDRVPKDVFGRAVAEAVASLLTQHD